MFNESYMFGVDYHHNLHLNKLKILLEFKAQFQDI